jgi:hypothetical protein
MSVKRADLGSGQGFATTQSSKATQSAHQQEASCRNWDCCGGSEFCGKQYAASVEKVVPRRISEGAAVIIPNKIATSIKGVTERHGGAFDWLQAKDYQEGYIQIARHNIDIWGKGLRPPSA